MARSARAVGVAVLLLAAGCGEAADPARGRPALPGVAPGEREWFWRDVLARPQPGEAAPDDAALAAEPPSARIEALVALAVAGDPRAPATLMAALRDEQTGVAAAAAELIGARGHARAVTRLLDGIGAYPVDYDLPPEVRMAEAAALARLGNPAGMPLILMALAENTDLETGYQALEWPRQERIAHMQELALPGLRALAGTDFGFRPYPSPAPAREAAVRAAQAWWREHRVALWAAAPLDDPGLVARVRLLVAHLDAYQLRQIDDARFILSQLGPGVLPYVQEGLESANDYLRMHGLEVLERMTAWADSKLRVRIAGAAAKALLEDPVPGVAAQAAATIGAAGVADQLLVAIERRAEPDVRVAIVDALGRAGRPEGLPPLRRLEEDTRGDSQRPPPPPDLRAALEAALLALEPARPVDALVGMLGASDSDLAFAALSRLAALTGGSHGFDPLMPPGPARDAALAAARAALEARGAHTAGD